jgi:hypothetical protein
VCCGIKGFQARHRGGSIFGRASPLPWTNSDACACMCVWFGFNVPVLGTSFALKAHVVGYTTSPWPTVPQHMPKNCNRLHLKIINDQCPNPIASIAAENAPKPTQPTHIACGPETKRTKWILFLTLRTYRRQQPMRNDGGGKTGICTWSCRQSGPSQAPCTHPINQIVLAPKPTTESNRRFRAIQAACFKQN